jgi:hypothetical protein
MKKARIHLVRSAYQPPASITFLSEQTSHQPSATSQTNRLIEACNVREDVTLFF